MSKTEAFKREKESKLSLCGSVGTSPKPVQLRFRGVLHELVTLRPGNRLVVISTSHPFSLHQHSFLFRFPSCCPQAGPLLFSLLGLGAWDPRRRLHRSLHPRTGMHAEQSPGLREGSSFAPVLCLSPQVKQKQVQVLWPVFF